MTKPYTIGITGGSGSGKTYFIKELAAMFPPQKVCLISQDNYYKPIEQQILDANGIENFDLPEAIDRDLFLEDIRRIKHGEKVSRKEYTFNTPSAEAGTIEYVPAPILIVEGLFIFGYPEIEAELDLKIFIEAKDHIKLSRRIRRDNQERGYDLSDVLYRYEHHVMPVYESFILPLRATADLIIPNNANFARALNVIVSAIKERS